MLWKRNDLIYKLRFLCSISTVPIRATIADEAFQAAHDLTRIDFRVYRLGFRARKNVFWSN